MHRRRFLALSTAGLAGCVSHGESLLSGPGTGLPDECPVDTLPEYGPPDDLTVETVVEFVKTYEVSYLEAEVLPENTVSHQIDIRGSSAEESGAGFAIDLDLYTHVYVGSEAVVAEPGPADVDSVPVEDLEREELADLARDAVDRNATVEREWDGGPPDEVEDELASLPGDEDGRYVDVDGKPVQLWTERDAVPTHGPAEVAYYVDDRVVRRTSKPEPDDDPEDGELLECDSN